MFLSQQEKNYPMVQVLITKKVFVYFDVSSNGYGHMDVLKSQLYGTFNLVKGILSDKFTNLFHLF